MPFAGEVTRKRNYNRSIGGSLSMIGTVGVSTQVQRLIQGVLSMSGAVTLKRSYKRQLGGSISFSGIVSTKAAQRIIEGILSFKGTLTRVKNGIPVGDTVLGLARKLTNKITSKITTKV